MVANSNGSQVGKRDFEYANIESSPGNTINVSICALGGSIATPSAGIRANVVEVKKIEDLALLGKDKIEGKIVFLIVQWKQI